MTSMISTTEAARHLGDVLARVRHTGEPVLLIKSQKPIARLVPVGGRSEATGDRIMKALADLPHDPEFGDDLEKVGRLDRVPENPWG